MDRETASPRATQITDALPPFDKHAADVILRSVDLVDFRVRKGILAECSTFFEAMFNLPAPATAQSRLDIRDGLPVVRMSEDSEVLERLLRICYPVPNPEIKDLDELHPVLRAAVKLSMDEAVNFLKAKLRKFAKESPVRVYAIAARYNFDQELKHSARCFLSYTIGDQVDAPELEDITGGAYHRLLQYHRACGAVATDFSTLKIRHLKCPGDGDWVWLSNSRHNCPQSGRNDYVQTRYCTTWWVQHMQRSTEVLRARPSGKAINTRELIDEALKEATACLECRRHAFEQLRVFSELFAAEVDKATAKVVL